MFKKSLRKLFSSHPALTQHKGFLAIFAINFAVFLLTWIYPPALEALALRMADWSGAHATLRGLINLFTHSATHIGFNHFFYNFLFVLPFAVYLERRIGTAKFVASWLLTGLGAAAVFMVTPSLFPVTGCVGASGACFGIMTLACVMIDEHPIFRMISLFVLGSLALPQYQMLVISTIAPTGVAYSAHIGGLIAGLVLASYFRRHKSAGSR